MKKKNWFWLGISVIILLSIGIICWHVVNSRNSYSANTSQVGQVVDRSDSTPTIYLHGWGASGKSTDSMIAYAEQHNHAHKVLTAQVKRDGTIVLRGIWPKGTVHPIIQLVFADNKNGNYYLTRECFTTLSSYCRKNTASSTTIQ
ncbi:alpha/beta hydrolase [Lactobacillus sp. ESL0679]|uniref:alpha/beta hydrolase n=1 Tax=Lactobacillus sp. ESL0679 TaxID=2983209 RepID=UPI0023F9603E|nr:alpha/beta hydrolase [Lactobacillus sp. ESL0679]MDF7682031.1 alpha/beta hydrolase [Lactobacillus sp. ESL0679]